MSIKDIIQLIETADKRIILIVFALSFLNIYLQFKKWKTVSKSLLNIDNNKKLLNSLFFGFTGGIITPIRVGEYLGRKIALGDQSLVKVTISTLIDKFASLYFVLLIGGIVSVTYLNNFFSILPAIPIIFMLVLLVIISFMIFNNDNRIQFLLDKLPQNYKFLRELKTELEYVNKMDSNSIKKLLRYALLLYCVIILQYALLALSFEPSGNLFLFLGAGSIILFAKSFLSFLSFADLGIRETISVYLLKNLGYTTAVGFNSAFFLFFFNLLIPSIIGVFLFFKFNSKSIINNE